jgi:hypothetical protein
MKIAVLLLFTAAVCFGQPTPSPQAYPGTPTPAPRSLSISSDSPDTQYLRGQLDTLHSLHDSMLNTVHWALGIAFTITAVLVGYNWFVIGRSLDRDKKAIQQELTGELASQEAKFQALVSNQIRGEAKTLERELESMTAAATRELHASIKQLTSNLAALRADFERQTAEARCESLLQEARFWNLQGTKPNEFVQYLDLLQLAMARRISHRITTALAELLRLLKTDMPTYSSELATLTGALNNLPSDYSSHVQALKAAIAAKVGTALPA